MNTNLRAMIDDALDGAYAHEQEYGYTETGDVGHIGYGDEGGAIKLASALNYVAANLNDLGTTEEKIAELELFSEMLKEANEAGATAQAAEEAAEKATGTFGQFYDDLKGGSGKSVTDAFKNMSTARKVAVGGGAGLIGLGALYGGYKALGGGSEKKSSLDEARSRALVKMAQHHDISVEDLEDLIKEAGRMGDAWKYVKSVPSRIKGKFGKAKGKVPVEPEESLGFFAKNKNALIAAGGLTAAGATGAGIGMALDKNDSGKSRPKTASYSEEPPEMGKEATRNWRKFKKGVRHAERSAKVSPTYATPAEKGAEELGFLAKNRRSLLAAGGLGAAGLAGYGLYRAMKGNSPTKTAGYMSKVAEDRINPARIRAGASDPFSGFDIRSHGGGGSRFDPIALRAQRIRAQVNSDMQGHVNNVGGGYNLERYLNRFNK